MIPLAERLRIAEMNLNLIATFRADKTRELSEIMDELIAIAAVAMQRKNYKLLGQINEASKKLGTKCAAYVSSHPQLILRFMENFRVEASDAGPLLEKMIPPLQSQVSHRLIDALVENILRNEAYIVSGHSRAAHELISSFIELNDRSGPVVKLCEAVAHTNTEHLAGASSCLNAIRVATNLAAQSDEEQRLHPGTDSAYFNKSAMIQEITHWLRDSEMAIAQAIREGDPSEWVTIQSIDIAEQWGLAVIAANLLTRMDMISFKKLAVLAKEANFYTDERQIKKIFETHVDVNDPQRAEAIAYCLAFKDFLPDMALTGGFIQTFATAATFMGDEPLNPIHGQNVLERMVEKITSSMDISPLRKTSLHPHLMKIRKYRGMALENDLGM
jgi:hypothetical protein